MCEDGFFLPWEMTCLRQGVQGKTREIVEELHRHDYAAAGESLSERCIRTIETFLPPCTGMGILEWTCANIPISGG
jgi:hypothetical protein